MIQTISPNEDLVLDLVLSDKTGNVIDSSLIANLQFVVFTQETSEMQRVYLSGSRYRDQKLYVNSSELQLLSSGQLYITTAIALLNSQYNDGTFDYIKTNALPYYLNNSALSPLSDNESLLNWRINVTRTLQDIDSALSSILTRLNNVEVAQGNSDTIQEILASYATIQYVDEQDSSIVSAIPNAVDLTPYATTEDVSAAISAIPEPDFTPYALKSAIPSLEGYATEQYVDEHDASVANAIPSVEGLATETFVTEQVSNIDLSPFATTEDVSTALADKADKNEIPSLDGYATEQYVGESISAIPAVDLTPYATTEDVSVALASKANTTDLPDLTPYATTADVSVALADKADKNEIPSLEGYATETFVTEHDASVAAQIPSLDGYATEQYVGESISAIPEVDLTPYATSEDVSTALAGKADKNEIPSLEGYATEQYVDEHDSSVAAQIPSLEGYATDASVAEAVGAIDLTPYATTEDVSTALAAKADASDLDNYVTDASLSETLEDYITDASVAEGYISNSQMENVELSVATAVNRLTERVENIETTLQDDGSDDSSTGDSSTDGSSSYEMTVSRNDDESYQAATYTITGTVPTSFTVTIPAFEDMPTTWDNVTIDQEQMMKMEHMMGDPMMPTMPTPDSTVTFTGSATASGYVLSVSNTVNGAEYQFNVDFIYNETTYHIFLNFTTESAA